MKASLQPKPMYCSRDYYYSSRFNQQYEKPTPTISGVLVEHRPDCQEIRSFSEAVCKATRGFLDLTLKCHDSSPAEKQLFNM